MDAPLAMLMPTSTAPVDTMSPPASPSKPSMDALQPETSVASQNMLDLAAASASTGVASSMDLSAFGMCARVCVCAYPVHALYVCMCVCVVCNYVFAQQRRRMTSRKTPQHIAIALPTLHHTRLGAGAFGGGGLSSSLAAPSGGDDVLNFLAPSNAAADASQTSGYATVAPLKTRV